MSEKQQPQAEATPERRETERLRIEWNKLEGVHRHILLVQDSCFKLARALHADGDVALARTLIANSLIHDNSKFRGIEWECLTRDAPPVELKLAHRQHVTTNPHHPEYWGDVSHMPRVYVAEMLCDWKARSDEFGDSLRNWIKETAFERYQIAPRGKVAGWIRGFMGMLLEKPFGRI